MIDIQEKLSIQRQCQLLEVSRSSYYYRSQQREIDKWLQTTLFEIHEEYPFFIPSQPNKPAQQGTQKYPYLLKGVKITHCNQVWSADISYIPLGHSHVYLVGIIDWYSRKVLSYRVSNTMDKQFCLDALDEALRTFGLPEIFNTDQGSQFTSHEFTGRLKSVGIALSMDGKGRALDNIFIERWFRSLKYEDIYLKNYQNVLEVRAGIKEYIRFYNQRRYHASLDYLTPDQVYDANRGNRSEQGVKAA